MGLAVSKQEAFWEACGFGHTEKVKHFIEAGINVNWVSYTHNSSAIHVASQGKPQIVRMLIEAKCHINVQDDRGNLALHHAAMKGHAAIMQMLIDAGSEIDVQDKNGWTPLINAAYFCQPDAVKVLIDNNCDARLQNKDERTALHEACRSQSEDDFGLAIIVCHLIEAGCDLNTKSSDHGGADFTPLMFAAYHGHPDVAEALMEAQCDINAQGSNGWSALHWAADMGHKAVVRALLAGDIDPLLEGRRGELALDRAQASEMKDLLHDATVTAQRRRDESDGFMCHSPVSTTSPLSSRSSSLSDLTRDDDADDEGNGDLNDDQGNGELNDDQGNGELNDDQGNGDLNDDEGNGIRDNDLAAQIQEQKENIWRDGQNNGTATNGTSTTTTTTATATSSGSVSEKDEKETPEKEFLSDSPLGANLSHENGCKDSSTHNGHTADTVHSVTIATTNLDINNQSGSTLQSDLCDKTRTESGISSSDSAPPTNNDENTSNTKDENGVEPDNDLDTKGSLAASDLDPPEVTQGSLPLKLNPQLRRLVAPPGGLSDGDDGNVSDDIIGDGGYSDDLLDSDVE